VTAEAEIYVPLEGLVDVSRERERIDGEVGILTKELNKIKKKLGNQDFLKKAPKDVVERTVEKKREFEEKLTRLTKNLAMLED
jgi:valyl-tRNA synthetase